MLGIYHFKPEAWDLDDYTLINKYKEHGFDTICFYANYQPIDTIESCVKYARNIGLTVDTIHGPLKNNAKIWEDDYHEYLHTLKQYIKLCAKLNIKYFILHTAGKECVSFCESGLNNFKELIKLARSLKVIILAENLRTVDHLIFLTEHIKSKYFQICLDVGHANVWCYKPCDFINKFKTHIKAVHLHDNLGQVGCDLHLIPFQGNIDWNKLIPHLYRYYQGPITLELDNFKTKEYQYKNIDNYLKDAYSAAKKLLNLTKKHS